MIYNLTLNYYTPYMVSENNDDMADYYFGRSPLAVFSAGLKFSESVSHIYHRDYDLWA